MYSIYIYLMPSRIALELKSYVGNSKSVWELYLPQGPIWSHVEVSSTEARNKMNKTIKNFPLYPCFCDY